MAVSIEVVDSRLVDRTLATPQLRLADQQSHGGLVLGSWQPYVAHNWATQRCEVRIGSQETVVRTGTCPLGDPAWLLSAWLQHMTHHGATVPAGAVVSTSTWCGVLRAQAGDTVTVEFPGIGSASCKL